MVVQGKDGGCFKMGMGSYLIFVLMSDILIDIDIDFILIL